MLLALVVTGLAGCVTGDVSEQRAAEEREATRGAELPDVQATNLAERFKEGTPSPAPTRTPNAGINRLVIAANINGDNSPQNELSSAPSGGTIYACAQIAGARRGETVIAVWSVAGGGEIARSETRVDRSDSLQWFALPWQTGGPGTYSVTIYLAGDDHQRFLNSLVFRVG